MGGNTPHVGYRILKVYNRYIEFKSNDKSLYSIKKRFWTKFGIIKKKKNR